MKNIIYLISLIIVVSQTTEMYSQTPYYDYELCKDKVPIFIDTSTVIPVDSVSQPSEKLGEFETDESKILDKEEKVVIFLHGLAGNPDAWISASNYSHSEYMVAPYRPTYSQNTTIPDAFNELDVSYSGYNVENTNDGNPDYTPEQTLVIAHSLGGVMTRYMDDMYENGGHEREFGAFATFGSPHAGAAIINNIPDVKILLKEGCEIMSEPTIVEFLQDAQGAVPGWVEFLLPKLVTKFMNALVSASEGVQNFICDDLIDPVFGLVEGSIAPSIGQDIAPQSDVIYHLSHFESQIPGIAFYGVEDEPVSYREIYSLNNNVNTPSWGGANQDDEYIEMAEEISSELEMMYEFHNLHTETLFMPAILPPYILFGDCLYHDPFPPFAICLETYCDMVGGHDFNFETLECSWDIENPVLAQAYYNAWIWWNDFNRNYKIIFGHIEIEVDEVWDTQCKCTDPQFGWVTYHDGSCDNQPETQEWYCHDVIGQLSYTVTEEHHPGDGVVPKYSASSFPGVRASTEMPGSNHQQMRNDKNTADAFRRMFGGYFGVRFKQTER